MDAPLLIADVPWLLYRAFFSLPKSIKGADGKPVNALLGTVNALLAASEAQPPRAVVACFGAEEARYRVEAYRPLSRTPRRRCRRSLREQWGRAPELLASFGWTIADAAELEADDAMGSFARVEARAGGRALLLTADRDLYQCVEDNVAVLDLGKGGACSVLGASQVHDRYGIAPGQVPDFIALRGDPSDGLPGAPGIGAKTAAELLRSTATWRRCWSRPSGNARRTAIGDATSARRSVAVRERRAAAHVQARGDARGDRRAASAGHTNRLRRRRGEGTRDRHGALGRATPSTICPAVRCLEPAN